MNSLNADLLIYDISQFIYSCSNSKLILFEHTNTRYELKKKERDPKRFTETTDIFNPNPAVLLKETAGFQYLKDQYRGN